MVEPIAGSDRSQVDADRGGRRSGRHPDRGRWLSARREPVPQSVIALAAVLYDEDGKTWTYTNPSPLTFVPQEVVIAPDRR